MSREALASCRTALELIAEVTTEPTIKALAARALAGLGELQKRDDERRDREATRKRNARADGRAGPPPSPERPRTSADVRGTGTDVRVGGRGGDLSGDQDPERIQSPTVGDPGEGPPPSTDVRGRRAVNATDDGAVGFAVAAWCDGISQATGRPFTLLRGVTTAAIVEAIVRGCPDVTQREAWARAKGKAFAEARVATRRVVKAIEFPEWLASGEPGPRESGVQRTFPAVQPIPATGRVWRASE